MSKSNKENDLNLSPEEKLHMENEIEKLKLSAFNDAKFFSKEELPPEVESEWLKYIAHFEKNYEDVERIKIADKLGYPEFPAAESLSDQEIEKKLHEVLQLMADYGIFLDVLAETPDAEIYRFIIEELFQEQIDDVDIEGLQTVFIYEEFYPNDKLDIEHTIEDFLLQLFDEQFHNLLDGNVAEKCKTAAGKPISDKKAVEKAIAFSKLYDHLELGILNNFKFDIAEQNNKASVLFDIFYEATTEQRGVHFEGEATALMTKGKLGYWNIVTLEMPGFAF